MLPMWWCFPHILSISLTKEALSDDSNSQVNPPRRGYKNLLLKPFIQFLASGICPLCNQVINKVTYLAHDCYIAMWDTTSTCAHLIHPLLSCLGSSHLCGSMSSFQAPNVQQASIHRWWCGISDYIYPRKTSGMAAHIFPHFSLHRNIICVFPAHTHDPSHCFIAFNQQSQGPIKQIRLVNSMGYFHNKLLLFLHSLQSHSAEQLIYHCGQPELGCT